jgi:hypothetical protein
MVGELVLRHAEARDEAFDAASALAIKKDRLRGGGTPPHSVRLLAV